MRTLSHRIRAALDSNTTGVLIVTVSVQGLVVAAQLFTALVVSPEDLGRIRWLESAFSIGLLAASFGMPSIAFREAALYRETVARAQLLAHASLLSSAGAVLLIGCCAAAVFALQSDTTHSAWLLLLFMSVTAIPSNAARIAIAVVQGAQLARQEAPRLLVYSAASVVLLAIGAAVAGPPGWVAARFLVEAGLAWMLFRSLFRGAAAGQAWRRPERPAFTALVKRGAVANYGFLVRVLADNLPMLLLGAGAAHASELGLFGFANLLLLAPILLLSVTMQARLPGLIQSIHSQASFSRGLRSAMWTQLGYAMIWCLSALGAAFVIQQQWVLPSYSAAAVPLALLAACLPGRAMVLTAGGAAIAHGWFALPSLLALTEIAIVAAGYLLGARDAVHLALAVAVSQAVIIVPSYMLLRAARRACVAS